MLDTASKYKFVPTSGHTINGAISLSDNVLRWQNVSWMNEGVGEWAGALGVQGLTSYSCANYPKASDIQRCADWMRSCDARTIVNDGTRFFTGYSEGFYGWTKIADSRGSSFDAVLYNAELSASNYIWNKIVEEKKNIAKNVNVASGDPVRVAPIREILNGFQNFLHGSIYNYMTLYGSMTVTRSDSSSHITSNLLSPRSTTSGVYRNVNDHAKYISKSYSNGSVISQLSTDSVMNDTAMLYDAIGDKAFFRKTYLNGAILALSFRYSDDYDTMTQIVSTSTYYHVATTGSGRHEISTLDWSSLKSLSAPSVPVPSTGVFQQGVYLFQCNVDPLPIHTASTPYIHGTSAGIFNCDVNL